MILIELSPAVRAHVAVAVRAHVRQLARDGHVVPADLVAFASAMLSAGQGGRRTGHFA